MKKLKKAMVISLTCIFTTSIIEPVYGDSDYMSSESIVARIEDSSKTDLQSTAIRDKIKITDADRDMENDLDMLLSSKIRSSEMTFSLNTSQQADLYDSDFTLLEASQDNEEKVISYQVYNDRFTLHYYPDGTILKTVTTFADNEQFVYYENFDNTNNNTVDSTDLPDLKRNYQIEEGENCETDGMSTPLVLNSVRGIDGKIVSEKKLIHTY